MEYQLITDSCSDLPLEVVDKCNLDIVNFIINMNNEELVDDMGKTFDKEAFFQRLKNGETASTSQVNVHSYLEKFKYYVEKKIPVVYLAFSSALSGSFNSAVQAKKMLIEEYDEVDITIVDTKAASLGQGLLVYEACQKKEGGFSKDELIQWLEDSKLNYHSWVTVDDIRHLQRGGRISATAATVGTLLHVKPILVVDPEGKLIPSAKVRGRKKSINYLVDQTIAHLTDAGDHTIFVGHVGAREEAESIRDKLMERVES
ncbi:MAG: DegV family protein [Alkalibacterium sp.]|nr:DegV family protein [Alkalibacterium sp.]